MGKLITSSGPLSILCGLALALPVCAQSAANFNTAAVAPPAAEPEAHKQSAAEAGPVSVTPSRLVSPQELDSYVASLSSIFLMRNRQNDPFGHLQDPNAKPIAKPSASPVARRSMQMQATPFSDIVGLIVVTTVMPGEKSFLVGTRSFKQGDQVPLTFRGKPIRVQITEVSSRKIGFRNLDTGEIASRKLDMLPVGMTPGLRGITAPGMVADRPNAPLELESGEAEPVSNR